MGQAGLLSDRYARTIQEPITDLKGAIKDLAATPRELTLVAALLIKYRFVRTVDILPYVRLLELHTPCPELTDHAPAVSR